ncbi:MAG: hypothetical protein QMD03_01225 [Syntrophales bacterium]|nr:hypothetical protein [Syntrophales bacterium]
MEKIEILAKLNKLNSFSALSTDELKLYILLLISARELNRKEQIDLEIIRRVFGEFFTIEQLKKMGVSLKRYGLASLSFSCLEKDKNHRTSDSNGWSTKLFFELYDDSFGV